MRRAGQNPTETEVQEIINRVEKDSFKLRAVRTVLFAFNTNLLYFAKVDVDGSGYLEFPEYCLLMYTQIYGDQGDEEEVQLKAEKELQEVFRVFGKDETGKLDIRPITEGTCRRFNRYYYYCSAQGCITSDELKFVLTHVPGKVTYKEIDEMIRTVDENGDGKINYQEFRVMIGAAPNMTADYEKKKKKEVENTPSKESGEASGGAASSAAATKGD